MKNFSFLCIFNFLLLLTLQLKLSSHIQKVNNFHLQNLVSSLNQSYAQSQLAPFYEYFKQNYHQVDNLLDEQKIKNVRMLNHLQHSRFNLETLKKTCELSYDLYMTGKEKDHYFWFFNMHILFAFVKKGKSKATHEEYKMIQSQIQKIIKQLEVKYPPSENTQNANFSQIQNFSFDPVPDLLEGIKYYNQNQLQFEIQKLNQKSQKLLKPFKQFLTLIFSQKGNLETFKSGTKLPAKKDSLKYKKSMIRIQDKMFQNFINTSKIKSEVNFELSYTKYYEDWQKSEQLQINRILAQNKQNPQKKIKFMIFDLLRAKCQFNSVADIMYTLNLFQKAQKNGQIQIIIIKNRLSKPTKDVQINLKFGDLICQVQLDLKFDMIKNQFNHKLYELSRNPSGVILASLIAVFIQDKDAIQFYTELMTSVKNLSQIQSFNFFLTVIQQFLPSYALDNFVNSYSRKKLSNTSNLVSQRWNCIFYQFNFAYHSLFDSFKIQNETIFGQGFDMFGMFIIQGQKQNNSKNINMQKKYYRANYSFYYQGEMIAKNKIQGNYGIIQEGQRKQLYGSFYIEYVS